MSIREGVVSNAMSNTMKICAASVLLLVALVLWVFPALHSGNTAKAVRFLNEYHKASHPLDSAEEFIDQEEILSRVSDDARKFILRYMVPDEALDSEKELILKMDQDHLILYKNGNITISRMPCNN